jgi:hypothetical protein
VGTEDAGPLQEYEKDFSFVDLTGWKMGDALHIRVEEAPVFGIHTRGNRRNLDDLEVFKIGNTHRIQ